MKWVVVNGSMLCGAANWRPDACNEGSLITICYLQGRDRTKRYLRFTLYSTKVVLLMSHAHEHCCKVIFISFKINLKGTKQNNDGAPRQDIEDYRCY